MASAAREHLQPPSRASAARRTLAARVTSDPAVCSGKPCLRGTRIPVHLVLDLLAAGETEAGIRQAYSNLAPADIRACICYAAVLAAEEAGVTP